MSRKIRIAVIGASDATPDDIRNAEDVGLEIARNESILICGGLGGVMKSVARGAKRGGGLTVGILPGDDPDDANPFIDIPIVTGLGHARNVIVVYSADAVIAVGGKLGTLSEIAFSLIQGRPVIGLNTWNLGKERTGRDEIILAKNAKDAVRKVFELIKN